MIIGLSKAACSLRRDFKEISLAFHIFESLANWRVYIPDTTLPVLLFNEYKKFKEVKKERGWSVKKTKVQILTELREKAADRKKWREIVVNIVSVVCES